MKISTFKTAEQLVKFNIETNTEIRENLKKLISKELMILKIFSSTNVLSPKRVFKTHALNFIALYAICIETHFLYRLKEMHISYKFCRKNGISKSFHSSENFRRVKKLLGL